LPLVGESPRAPSERGTFPGGACGAAVRRWEESGGGRWSGGPAPGASREPADGPAPSTCSQPADVMSVRSVPMPPIWILIKAAASERVPGRNSHPERASWRNRARRPCPQRASGHHFGGSKSTLWIRSQAQQTGEMWGYPRWQTALMRKRTLACHDGTARSTSHACALARTASKQRDMISDSLSRAKQQQQQQQQQLRLRNRSLRTQPGEQLPDNNSALGNTLRLRYRRDRAHLRCLVLAIRYPIAGSAGQPDNSLV